ncbi:MAG TPA: DoxX family protein [Flavobacteriales bacterium]|nr:DoxX family protein [Flavobacteriales bacterium]HMR26854.1 DoxX family protein [Flavobacteriales bacterium]
MNKLNLTYWIITGLFSGFMVLSSYGGITLMPEAVALLHDHLGYPLYFIQLISYAKVLGAIAILLPMVPARVKEWAYFGFFIDLVAAVVSFIAVGDPVPGWAPMLLFIGVLAWAYVLHHRRLDARDAG